MKNLPALFSILFMCITVTGELEANPAAVRTEKISGISAMKDDLRYLNNNLRMYRYYNVKWTFKPPRAAVVKRLEKIMAALDKLESRNTGNGDFYLLRGDVAHFLYNLDEVKYYDSALRAYAAAAKINADDYRPVWFSAHHKCISGHASDGVKSYWELINESEAERLHWAFWGDYSSCSMIAGMPSNSMMAYEFMVRNGGKARDLEDVVYRDIKSRMVTPEAYGKISSGELWIKVQNEDIHICRPLGLRLHGEKGWKTGFGSYDSGESTLTITSPGGQADGIRGEIRVISHVPLGGVSFSSFAENFLSKFRESGKAVIENPYGSSEAFIGEWEDGAHVIVMLMERVEPAYPCAAIEYPMGSGNDIYRAKKFYTRFGGRLYYAVIYRPLHGDAARDIEALRSFLNNSLVID